MRIFWAIIALLTLAAAGAWYTRTSARNAESPEPIVPAASIPSRGAHDDPVKPVVPAPSTPAPPPSPADPAPAPRHDVPVQDPPNQPSDLPPPNSPPAPASETPAHVVVPQPTLAPKPSPAPKLESPAPAAPIVVEHSPAPSTPNDPPKPQPAKSDPPKPDAPKAPESKPAESPPAAPSTAKAKIVPQDDGSVLVDDKYPMKGKGTKDDPYRITWDQLVSAELTYQPRLGRKVIPDRIKMLDGKFIRISGYIAFPLMAQSADEMLMMLNQWDGCCIGQPPTPYDALEVKLKTPAKGDMRLRMTGTLTGVLRVDPYLVKDWLVSLYVMDDGELSDAAGQTTPGQHAK